VVKVLVNIAFLGNRFCTKVNKKRARETFRTKIVSLIDARIRLEGARRDNEKMEYINTPF